MSINENKPTLNVHQRFLEACKIISLQPWAKDTKNAQYKSIPIDDMRRGVRNACIEAGLIHIGPSDIDCKREAKGSTNSNMTLLHGSCTFSYVNVDDPTESIVFDSLGEAMDPGDKGTGKFITNLIKNHYKSAFDIGEQGKDDIDSYSNEEIYEEAERTHRRAESRNTGYQDVPVRSRRERTQTTDDPFFSSKKEPVPVTVSNLTPRNKEKATEEELDALFGKKIEVETSPSNNTKDPSDYTSSEGSFVSASTLKKEEPKKFKGLF